MHDPKPAPFDPRWMAVHRECERLADESQALGAEKREALALARQQEVHTRLGFRDFEEYVTFLFGPSFDDEEDP